MWIVIVRWVEPEDGVAVYGPYDHPPDADDIARVEPDFMNDGVLPEDVVITTDQLNTPS